MAVATIVWSSAPRKSATMMPASVKLRSLFVTVYMKRLVSFVSTNIYMQMKILSACRGSQTRRPVFTSPPFR